MIKGGYYIKARCIQNSEIAAAPPHVREIWDWLLKEANHSDKKYGSFTVKRGQLFRTYNEIREGLSWMVGWRKERYHENQMKYAMKFLRSRGMIDTTKAPRGVLVTICNYDTYQDPKNYESTNESTNESTQPIPGEYPSSSTSAPAINKNERTIRTKNVKNDKKKEEDKKEDKKNPLHSQCVEIYFDWYKKKFDMEPQFDGSDGKAMNKIIEFLKKNVKKTERGGAENGVMDELIITSWKVILDKYDSWDKFFRKQRRVRQIESNLSNLINNIRHGTRGSEADFSEGIREYLRKRGGKIY